MDMKTRNEMIMSNGMTRLEWFKKLDIGQNARPFEGEFRKIADIPYGTESERQMYDVYMPMEPGVYPVIFRVHGGGWYTGHRCDVGMKSAAEHTKRGYVVVSVGYRLSNEAVFPGPVEDVWNGICHALERAEEYGIDKNRVAISSGSAGTAIATLLAVQHPDLFKAAIMSASILDFKTMRSQFEMLGRKRRAYYYPDEDLGIEAMYLGGPIQDIPEIVEQATPANFITPDAPHFMLIHGLEDMITPYMQSIEFAREVCRITGDDTRVELVLRQGADHSTTGLKKDPIISQMRQDFLKQYV